MAEGIAERAEWHSPQFVAIGAGGQEAEVREKGVDVAAVGRRSGRRGAVFRLVFLLARAGSFAAPEDSPAAPVQCDGEDLFVFDGGEEDFITGDGGRGVAGRQSGFPNYIAVGPEFRREDGFVGDTRRV